MPSKKPELNACPISHDFNPFDSDYLKDPYPHFARIRTEEPIFYSSELDYWVVSRYADIREVFLDSDHFSASEAGAQLTPPCPAAQEILIDANFVPRTNLVDEDPPEHGKRRNILRQGMTSEQVAALEPEVRRFVTAALDRIEPCGEADLVRDLVYEVPALTAFRLMGVPEAEVDRVKKYASRLAIFFWGRPNEKEQVQLAQDFADYYMYAREHVAYLTKNIGTDYLSNAILASKTEDGAELFDEEYLRSLMIGHFFASHETTTNAAANGFRLLLENRTHWESICKDSALIPRSIEEILRHSSSVPAWRRITTRPTSLAGVDLPAGAKLLLLTGSANHDEEVFHNPETFDPTRKNSNRNLAFGWGRHRCLGENLARMEMRVIYEETSRRLPSLRLIENQEWEYSPNTSFRGPAHLFVTW
jgi:cytochrome P450